MKKLVSLIITSVLGIIFSLPIYAEETFENGLTLSRRDCIDILDAAGVEYDRTGLIGETDFLTNDDQTIKTISIIKEDGQSGFKQTVLFFDDHKDIIDVSKSLSYTNKQKEIYTNNVYITAYYYYATTNNGGTVYKLYRPYRLTSVSSVSQNMYLLYYTYGIKYNLNGVNQSQLAQHSITNSAYPAAVNQQYSTTNTFNGYLAGSQVQNGISLTHQVRVTINGVNKGYFSVT